MTARITENQFKNLRIGNLKDPRDVVCKHCKQMFVSYWSRESICSECKVPRGKQSGKLAAEARTASKSSALAIIAETQGKQRSSILEALDGRDYEWQVMFDVPFSLDVSKNRRWSNNGKGTVFLNEGVRRYSHMIVHTVKRAVAGQNIANNKVWISAHVEKPNHRCDAINVVDTLCDAIKEAIGIDDNWFCLGKIDWSIRKNNPSILVSIAQESTEDVLVCSHCGGIKPLDQFNKSKGGPLGRGRACRSCRGVLDTETRKLRKRIEEV